MGQELSKQFMRVFCAVELPEEVRTRAAEHGAHLRRDIAASGVKWEQMEKLHITLKFFGDVAADRLAQLSEAIARAARSVPPFTLTVEGTGAFPAGRRARVLWLGIKDEAGQLMNLHAHLEDECASGGFERDPRKFHPHLTIARLRFPEAARELIARHKEIDFPRISFPVNEIVLMRSELGTGGSRYSVLSRHSLGEH